MRRLPSSGATGDADEGPYPRRVTGLLAAGDKDRLTAGPCSPAVSSLFDVDAGDRAGDDQALDL
jgi:hypothetical protein